MTRWVLCVCVVVAAALGATSRTGAQGASPSQRIDWNAPAPWGPQDHSEPVELQKKEPFKIFDNVWYVGIQTAAPYLVTTSAGHVLFDATGDETAHLVLENIQKAGFSARDVKYLIITHAHVDHFGGAEQIRQATGARIGMSAEDWKLTEQLQASQGEKAGPRIARDLVIADGQKIALGDATLTFYVTPGHTPGATSTEFPRPRRQQQLPRPRPGRARYPECRVVTSVLEEHRAFEGAGAVGT